MRTATQNTIEAALAFLNETARIWREADWKGPFLLRGQRDNQWGLTPTLYRKTNETTAAAAEKAIFDNFKRRAPAYISELPADDLGWLSLMQHHGLETRLLDWTENFLAGLYFALRNADGETCPVVYMLNAEALNQHATGHGSPIPEENTRLREYATVATAPEYPAAIVLPHTHPRLAAQRGAFTAHGNNIDALYGLNRDDVLASVSFNMPESLNCRRQLVEMGVQDTLFFPDLDHLCKEVSQKVFENGA